jgi:hypothetical protein
MKNIVSGILQRTGLKTPDQEVSVKNWAASLLVTKISEVLDSLDKNKADVNHTHESSVPVGAIFAFPVDGEVPGYLKCNGSAHLISHYPKLAALLTTFKPATLAQDKFVVPDFRGQYLRGADDAASSVIATTGLTDPNTGAATTNSKTAGIRASDSFGQHKHSVTDPTHSHGAGQAAHGHTAFFSYDQNIPVYAVGVAPPFGMPVDAVNDITGGAGMTDMQQPQVWVHSAPTGITVNTSGEAETRPKSVLVNYYIKCDQ